MANNFITSKSFKFQKSQNNSNQPRLNAILETFFFIYKFFFQYTVCGNIMLLLLLHRSLKHCTMIQIAKAHLYRLLPKKKHTILYYIQHSNISVPLHMVWLAMMVWWLAIRQIISKTTQCFYIVWRSTGHISYLCTFESMYTHMCTNRRVNLFYGSVCKYLLCVCGMVHYVCIAVAIKNVTQLVDLKLHPTLYGSFLPPH